MGAATNQYNREEDLVGEIFTTFSRKYDVGISRLNPWYMISVFRSLFRSCTNHMHLLGWLILVSWFLKVSFWNGIEVSIF